MINELLNLLALHGGKIVCTNSAGTWEIQQAKASNRMYVTDFGIGYIWIPEWKYDFPTTVEEVKLFDKYYPIQPEIPDELKTLDWYHNLKKGAEG